MSLFDTIVQLLVFIIPSLILLYQFIFFNIGRKRVYTEVNLKNVPFLSIIVPTKGENVGVIQGLLDNLSKVEWDKSKMEIIIVSDDSKEYFDKLVEALHFPEGLEVKLYNRLGHEKKGYKSGALAYGYEKSKGDLVITLDVDARLNKDSLLKAYSHMISYGCDAVTMNWIGYTTNQYSTLARGLIVSTLVADYSILNGREKSGLKIFPVGCGTLFKREAIESVGPWDYSMIQDDLEIGSRLINKGKRICSSDSPVLVEVPDNLFAFYVQQTRWAMGSTEVLIRRFKEILKSKSNLIQKIDMILFLSQYFPIALTFIVAVILLFYSFIGYGDPLRTPLILVWLIALSLYAIGFISIAKKLGLGLIQSLRALGKVSAYTVSISPFVLLSLFKAFAKKRTYIVTPKGKTSKSNIVYIIGALGFAFLLSSIIYLIKYDLFSGIWMLYYSSAYLFTFFTYKNEL
ncbi:glycosyltransferase [Acidianus brierleyi]|uniref:Glycosyl transferase family 2 n=1 Tax=Acidianus brierleyi TaxID=41673 RepID=A0A2U9IF28_9CREN|nr:glycosyltransferase family 2 protein [Acidianus brierleyi]AWR94653.1 glycosyltransferase [Acidianus brierleyi]